jgi:hypothetical protein
MLFVKRIHLQFCRKEKMRIGFHRGLHFAHVEECEASTQTEDGLTRCATCSEPEPFIEMAGKEEMAE